MIYSTSNLTLIADCNTLVAWATREKANLVFKKLSDERSTVRYAETSQELDAELSGVIAEIAAQVSIIAVLPEGPAKEQAEDKKTKLEYKKFFLENRKETYGSVALLEKEMDLARVTREIEEVDEFITTITNHRNTLNS